MTIHVDFFRSGTTSLLEELEGYQTAMEIRLEDMRKKALLELQSLQDITDPEERREEIHIANEQFQYTYEFAFPRFLRYSFVVLLFLSLESELDRLCDEITRRRSLTQRARDFKARGNIAKFREYFETVVGISQLNKALWQRVEDLSDVRNCIVHKSGKVTFDGKGKHIRDIIKKASGLSIGGEDYGQPDVLMIRTEYCEQAVADVDAFFDSLFEAADFGPKHVEIS